MPPKNSHHQPNSVHVVVLSVDWWCLISDNTFECMGSKTFKLYLEGMASKLRPTNIASTIGSVRPAAQKHTFDDFDQVSLINDIDV